MVRPEFGLIDEAEFMEAMAARFPKADLSSRRDFMNESIDRILSNS